MSSVSRSNGPILEMENISFKLPGRRPDRERSFLFGSMSGRSSACSARTDRANPTILKIAAGMLAACSGRGHSLEQAAQSISEQGPLQSFCATFLSNLDVHVPFTVRGIVSMGLYPYEIPPADDRG